MTRGLCRRRAWQRSIMKKGVPVSPGIAVARAYCVDEVLARREPYKLGGERALADYLSVGPEVVRAWMNGSKALPPHVFSAVVDLIVSSARRETADHAQAKELR